jgi:hypothetical protein
MFMKGFWQHARAGVISGQDPCLLRVEGMERRDGETEAELLRRL